MKRALLITAFTALGFSNTGAAGAEGSYVISGGTSGGAYSKAAKNLANLLGSDSEALPSKGSIDNLQNIFSGKADAGITQLDALAYFMGKNPDAKLEVMGTLFTECIHLAVSTDGKVQDEDDLQSKGVSIAIGAAGSGSAITWEYLMTLEEGYKNAAVKFIGGNRALAALTSASSGVDAVMWVARPALDNPFLVSVMNNEKLKMIDLDDSDLNDTYAPIGKPVYEFKKIDIKAGLFGNKKVMTPCVDSVVVAHSASDEAFLDKLSGLVLNYKSTIIAE